MDHVEMMQKTDFPVTIIPILKALHLGFTHSVYLPEHILQGIFRQSLFQKFRRQCMHHFSRSRVPEEILAKTHVKTMLVLHTHIQTKKTLDSFDNTICFFLVIASQSKIE